VLLNKSQINKVTPCH